MDEKELAGKLVFLTTYYDRWLREVNSEFNVPMVNRIARVIKVFDWDTEEGKLLLAARTRSNKWGKFDPKDFKFVLEVYCPELKIKNNSEGFFTEEVTPKKYPGTENHMFEVIPEWMLDKIKSDKWSSFSLLPKKKESSVEVKSVPKKKVVKKSTKKRNVSR